MGGQDIKKVLWENVLALMEARYGKENLTKLANEAKVGPGSVSRIKEQKTSVGIGVVDKVARALKVPTYQLLIPPQDRILLRFVRVYRDTDDRGRLGLEIAVEGAERRADAGSAGASSTGKVDDR
jgi:hypothetical protein